MHAWEKRYAPKPDDDTWHPRFIEACSHMELLDHMLDLSDEQYPDDRNWFMQEYADEIIRIEKNVETAAKEDIPG